MTNNNEMTVIRSQWRPSHNTMLSLQQLGFDKEHLRLAGEIYKRSTSTPNDREFRAFVGTRRNSDLLVIPLDWSPEPKTTKKLKSWGYEEVLIKHASELFTISCREAGSVIVSRDSAFVRYLKNKYPLERLNKPLSKADWTTLVLKGACGIQINSALTTIEGMWDGLTTDRCTSSELRTMIEGLIFEKG